VQEVIGPSHGDLRIQCCMTARGSDQFPELDNTIKLYILASISAPKVHSVSACTSLRTLSPTRYEPFKGPSPLIDDHVVIFSVFLQIIIYD
jgi:hypothetical protein